MRICTRIAMDGQGLTDVKGMVMAFEGQQNGHLVCAR